MTVTPGSAASTADVASAASGADHRIWELDCHHPDVPTQVGGDHRAALVPGSCLIGADHITETIWVTPPSLVLVAPRH